MDRFLQQIKMGLNGHLDPKVFEDCAVDLLRADFPGIAPIPGGSDGGMDGAIPDGEGEPLPLVCTTGEDVTGNLKKNLESYIECGRKRRHAYFITSRALSAQKIEKLFDVARGLGFSLLQVFEQSAVANRLYRNPRWCRDLLNLTGQPEVLSRIPPNPRTDLFGALIGRDEELQWLSECNGDVLLVGQPAVGKTGLLKEFAEKFNGFFLTPKVSPTEIAAALREFQPRTVILDDAHVYLEDLETLLRFRRQMNLNFKIVASTWPSAKAEIAPRLSLAPANCRELRLLSRELILSIVKSILPNVRDEIAGEIVGQAHGKPGLAAFLSLQCLERDLRDLFKGDILAEAIMNSLAQAIGDKPKEILAAFSIGGEFGMKMTVVAKALGLPVIEVNRTVAHLASAGVVTEVNDSLIVRPPVLRFNLVRDVFFRGANSLPADILMDEAQNPTELMYSILGAKHRGAQIADRDLVRWVEDVNDPEVWKVYAWLGKEECAFALHKHPEHLTALVEPGLGICPDVTIPMILSEAIGDTRPLHSNPGLPLRKLEDWIKRVWPNAPEASDNKATLLRAALKWLKSGGDLKVGYSVLPNVFMLGFEQNSVDPGAGRSFILRHGVLSLNDIKKIEPLWDELFKYLREHVDHAHWKSLLDIVHQVNVRPYSREIPPEIVTLMRQFAVRILSDLAQIAKGLPGVELRIASMAQNFGATFDIAVDPIFETLFPERREFLTEEAVMNADVDALAIEWANRQPMDVARDLARLESQAKLVELSWPRLTTRLAFEIAKVVPNPIIWSKAMLEAGAPSDLAYHFLNQAKVRNVPGWEQSYAEALKGPLFTFLTSDILTMTNPPTNLLDPVIVRLPEEVGSLEYLVGRMPEPTVAKLLQHKDPKVREEAAIGEWVGHEQGAIRDSLRTLWRSAVLEVNHHEFWIKKILVDDKDLAFEWTARRIPAEHIDYHVRETIKFIAGVMTVEQRTKLIGLLRNSYDCDDLVLDFVQNDKQLYAVVLSKPENKVLCLALAEWRGGGEPWFDRLRMLLDAGFEPDQIAGHLTPTHDSFWGSMAKNHEDWLNRFAVLRENSDIRIQKIGNLIEESLRYRLDRALKEERDEEIYGR